jgi:hypothetical protein
LAAAVVFDMIPVVASRALDFGVLVRECHALSGVVPAREQAITGLLKRRKCGGIVPV